MGGETGPVTTISSTVRTDAGDTMSTVFSRSGVTVRFPNAMSARPSTTSGSSLSRVAGTM